MNFIKKIRQAAIAFAGLFSTSFGKTLEKKFGYIIDETPTAKDSWDPYDVFCRKKRGNLTHPDLYTGSHICKGGAK